MSVPSFTKSLRLENRGKRLSDLGFRLFARKIERERVYVNLD
jgi:hypothetical protein